MKLQKRFSILIILILLINIAIPVFAIEEDEKIEKTPEFTVEEDEEAIPASNVEENDTLEVPHVLLMDNEYGIQTLANDSWTDFSNAKISFSTVLAGDNSSYKMLITNFTSISGHSYHVFLSNSSTKPNNEAISNTSEITNTITISADSVNPAIEKSGESIYVWIVEEDRISSEEKEVLTSKQVEKPAIGKIGTRIIGQFLNEYTNFIFKEPNDEKDDTNQKIKLKIGLVTDNNILKSIQNAEADCLEKLLTYAKSANSVYTTQVPLAGNTSLGHSASITRNFNIVDGAYYYVYMELDDPNYRYINDVSLYQGNITSSSDVDLFNYLDRDFVWNLKDSSGETGGTTGGTTTNVDPTTSKIPLPKTGMGIVAIVAIVFVATIGTVSYFKYDKYKKV